MPPTQTLTHLTLPLGEELPGPGNDLARRSEATECECPFPWWLLLVGAAVGGVGGYYLGRRQGEASKLEPLE